MNNKLMLASMLALTMSDGYGYSAFERSRLPPEPKEPTKEQLEAEERTISEAEEKRRRKAEKRLKVINNQESK